MRTLPTTLLQILCKIILISKVITKSILDPDDDFLMNSEVWVNGDVLASEKRLIGDHSARISPEIFC